ncbi:MAG: hypothetical protein GY778_08820, partial [bacterium]|nr:hypothetical protein [bacterium]
ITDKAAVGTADGSQDSRITRLAGTATLTEYDPGAGQINIGTRDERILIKNYDSGKNRIDLFVVEDLSWHSWGEAFWTGARTADANAIDEVVNSVIVRKKPVADPGNSPIVLVPHEFGHVLTDMGAHSHEDTELMFEKVGFPAFIAKKENVDAPKRIFEPDSTHPVKYDGDPSVNPVKYLREHNKGLLENW